MIQITRRTGLQLIAGAAAASTLSGSARAAEASVDPAFAAIDKHRQASANHLAALYAADAVYGTEAAYDADVHSEACCHAQMDAAWELASTVPTTFAGVAAILQYANEVEDEGDEWPVTDTIGREGWHYRLRQTIARAAATMGAV